MYNNEFMIHYILVSRKKSLFNKIQVKQQKFVFLILQNRKFVFNKYFYLVSKTNMIF